MTTDRQTRWMSLWALMALTVIWLTLSLYHLGYPSLFWEEILVALTARYPIPYIYDWSSSVETHPPLFYIIIKLFQPFGPDETLARLPSVLFGTGCIFALFSIVKRLHSTGIALLAVSILIINPTFIMWSRVVRPYSLFLFLFLIAFNFMLRYVRGFGWRDLCGLLFFNILLVWTHYLAYFIFLTEGIIIFCCLAKNYSQKHLVSVLKLGIGMVLVILSNWNMLYATVLKNDYFKAGKLSILETALQQMTSVTQLMTYFDVSPLLIFICVAIGLVVMAIRNTFSFWLAMAFLALPLSGMCLLRAGWFGPNYLIFLLPFFATTIAVTSMMILRKEVFAAFLSVILSFSASWTIFRDHYERLYAENSYNFGINKQRDYATSVNALPPGVHLVFCSEALRNSLGWYLDTMSNDAIKSPALGSETAETNIAFILNEPTCVGYAATDEDLFHKLGAPVQSINAGDVRIHRWSLKRMPASLLSDKPEQFDFPSVPETFYRYASELDKVCINMDWGGRVVPTANSQDTSFSYVFENVATGEGRPATIGLNFKNPGQGNTLRLLYRFDDEPFQTAFSIAGPWDNNHRQVSIDRTLPFRKMTIKVVMFCGTQNPAYPGNNLSTISVDNLHVQFGATYTKPTSYTFGLFKEDPLTGDIQTRGLGALGRLPRQLYRWGLGAESEASFTLPEDAPIRFSLGYLNVIPGQSVTLLFNGDPVQVLKMPEADPLDGQSKQFSIDLKGKRGRNTLAMRYAFWNLNKLVGKPARYMEGTDEPVALYVTGFEFTTETPP